MEIGAMASALGDAAAGTVSTRRSAVARLPKVIQRGGTAIPSGWRIAYDDLFHSIDQSLGQKMRGFFRAAILIYTHFASTGRAPRAIGARVSLTHRPDACRIHKTKMCLREGSP